MNGRFVAIALLPALYGAQALAFEGDPFKFSLSAGYLHDSNVFRLPDDFLVSTLTGSDQRGDTTYQLAGSLGFERDYGPQHIRLNANITDSRYSTYSFLDNTAYDAGASWRLNFLTKSFVEVAYGRAQYLLGFADFRSAVKNIIARDSFDLRSLVEFRPRWSVIASTGIATYRNSSDLRSATDFELGYVEAGLRYDWLSGSNWDFAWRSSDGRYPNQQLNDAAGNPIPGAVDNNFRENTVLARLSWAATGATRFNGQLGYTERRLPNQSERNFSGLTWRLGGELQTSDKFFVSATIRNELSAYQDIVSNYAVLRGISLGATWSVTDKAQVRGSAEWLKRDFRGDPGLVLTTQSRREDTIKSLGVSFALQPTSYLEWTTDLRREERDSNQNGFNYRANTLFTRLNFRN